MFLVSSSPLYKPSRNSLIRSALYPHHDYLWPSLVDYDVDRWLRPSRSVGLLGEMLKDIEKFDEQVSSLTPWKSASLPIDIKESPNAYDFTVDLPGVSKDKITINIKDRVLTISAEREESKKEEGKHYHREEITRGSFSRSLSLPENADEDRVSASFENGVLTLHVEKAPESKETEVKKIEIA